MSSGSGHRRSQRSSPRRPIEKSQQGIELRLLRRTLDDLFEVAQRSILASRPVPSLVLVYTAIDILASLERGQESVGEAFRRWVARYLLAELQTEATPADLWGARCGIVHTASANSDLMNRGQARPIIYAGPFQGPDEVEELARSLGHETDIVIGLGDLATATEIASGNYLSEIESHAERARNATANAPYWLCSTGPPEAFY